MEALLSPTFQNFTVKCLLKVVIKNALMNKIKVKINTIAISPSKDVNFYKSQWLSVSKFSVDYYESLSIPTLPSGYIIWAWLTCMSPYDKLMLAMTMLPVPDHLSIVVSSGDVNIRLVGLLQSIPMYNTYNLSQNIIQSHNA